MQICPCAQQAWNVRLRQHLFEFADGACYPSEQMVITNMVSYCIAIPLQPGHNRFKTYNNNIAYVVKQSLRGMLMHEVWKVICTFSKNCALGMQDWSANSSPTTVRLNVLRA